MLLALVVDFEPNLVCLQGAGHLFIDDSLCPNVLGCGSALPPCTFLSLRTAFDVSF